MNLVPLTLLSALLGCSNNLGSPNVTPSEPVDPNDRQTEIDALAKKWKRSQNQFTLNMKELSDMERLYVVRQILSNPNAEHSPRLCQTLSDPHQEYCMQMLSRSHIWDIPLVTQSIIRTTRPHVEGCDDNDVWCLTSKAIQEAKHGRIEQSAKICESLLDAQSIEECFFQTAEQIAKQDQTNSLENAFTFCQNTTAYLEHCHAHIIENAARTFQSPPDLLTIIENKVSKQQSTFLQEYYLTMKARQSPFNRFIPYWDKHSVQTLIFLSTQSKVDNSLSHWIELFHEAQSTISTHTLRQDEEMNNYWVQQGRAQHPSKLYLSLETRPYSKDKSLDLQFAMVAALIHRRFPVDTIKNQTEHPTIQWMLNRASHKR